jgi:hypothetical protein
MSEHKHEHHEREDWKAELSHAFKQLKAADDDRDMQLRHHQEEAQRIVANVFPPVFAQFEQDAKEHGFRSEVRTQQNGRQRLMLQGPSNCQLDFWTEATPEDVRVVVLPPSNRTEILFRGRKHQQFHEADLGRYLAKQLEAIKPK